MTRFGLLATGAALTMLPTAAGAQQIEATAGGGWSTGDYGSSRSTTMANASVGARWTSGGTTISGSVPFIAIDTPGVVFSGFDGTPLVMVPDLGGRRRTHSGVGDPTFAISQDVPVGSVSLRGTWRIKVPVQGFNGISTGKVDWSMSGEVSRPVGRITPFVAVSYRVFGDPTGWRIRDGFAGSVGASAPVGRGALAVSYEVARATSDYIGDSHEIVGVYSMPVANQRMRLGVYGTAGLSSGAPGAGAGLRLSVRL